MKKIAVAGIGGVGGYFGGLLAGTYSGSDIEIFFLARGENEKAIRKKGLELRTTHGVFNAFPAAVSSDPTAFQDPDLLICTCKSYDLENLIRDCKPMICPSTSILPLLNGVDARERILRIAPEADVWNGCVYLVARLLEPGIVSESGNVRKLFFGSVTGSHEKLLRAEKLFQAAGIDAIKADDITATIWEKFLFISPIATLTSYLDKTFGEVFSDPWSQVLLSSLLSEIKSLAEAKGVRVAPEITEKNIEIMKSLPGETTTSMHRDFRKGGKTEVESLTGYVVREAAAAGVPVPVFERMYDKLVHSQRPLKA